MLGVAVAGVVLAYFSTRVFRWTDFDVFLNAAKAFRDGGDIYDVRISDGVTYLYSPFFACLLTPLLSLPRAVVKFGWLCLNVPMLLRCVTLVRRWFADQPLDSRRTLLWGLCVGVVALRFLGYLVNMTQMNLFMLWASLEGLQLMQTRRSLLGGLLLGLAVNIKLLPLPLLPYLAYRRLWPGLLCTVAAMVLFLVLPAAFVGWERNLQMLAGWWQAIDPRAATQSLEYLSDSHSLTAVLPQLLLDGPGTLGLLHLSPEQAGAVILGARVLLVLLTLRFLGWPPFVPARSALHAGWELSYILLVTPLLFPKQQKYAFLAAVPAVVYLAHHFLRRKNPWGQPLRLTAFGVAVLGMSFLIGSDVLGRPLYEVFMHYKLLAVSVLLLVPLLAASPPPSACPPPDSARGSASGPDRAPPCTRRGR